LLSEGKGHTFESCRARQCLLCCRTMCPPSNSIAHMKFSFVQGLSRPRFPCSRRPRPPPRAPTATLFFAAVHESVHGTFRTWRDVRHESASLIGHSGSSTFRLSATAVSMSLAGSCFSTESAPRPFHHGIRGRGGTIFRAALPSEERQDQADSRTHLIHRPARDILPLLGGSRVFSYRV
jgi:hypothetical protein